ncbi:MAG: HU family DNA-binding protein [Muribaculaceae bacterium]|jgi:nucleoid DNA-binding protein|nr:HU family DNA-binding protein [Muribaculaceae bacterium]
MENKKLVETVATNLGRTTEDVNKLLEALANVLRTRCSELDSVFVPGFGTFEPKKRNERVMVHPSSGKRMLVPPKVVVGFKVSRVLKAKLK